MLKSLQIENYAIIRALNIKFEDGFTVITGETGAGKSILMGALSLLLGNRAETDVLFDKSRKCIVEGIFDIRKLYLNHFFESNDLDFQDYTSIRREINESGKSRAFINDTPVNLVTLKSLTSKLVDIHSQHKTLMLQETDFQLALLDQYAKNQNIVEEYKNTLKLWKTKKKEYSILKEKNEEASARYDYNNFVINELESAELQNDEQEILEHKIAELSNAENIKIRLFKALNILSENENSNIVHSLTEIGNELRHLSSLGGEYESFCQRIESLLAESRDISFDITRKSDTIDINPDLLDSMNNRLDLIFSLQKKYRVENNDGLLKLLETLKKENSEFSDNKELLENLSRELVEIETLLKKSSEKLTESRKKSIPNFIKSVKNRLNMLDLGKGDFDVILNKKESYDENGTDETRFMFSGNRGVAPTDLTKTASGGELSRIMLCLKSIITDSILLPTVIFDEIDSGISGTTASKVAEVMLLLALNHQVISITHLPQIAAKAQNHFLVFKELSEKDTETMIKKLDATERERVIATMLSGDVHTEAALKTAHDMLNNNSKQ